MFCENCGNKLDSSHKFCTRCGSSATHVENTTASQPEVSLDGSKWRRLLKVLYIVAYLPLLIVVPIVWSESSYSSYYGYNYGEAFWYSFLTFIIWVIVLRLMKIAVLYVIIGYKPKWKEEFKKLF